MINKDRAARDLVREKLKSYLRDQVSSAGISKRDLASAAGLYGSNVSHATNPASDRSIGLATWMALCIGLGLEPGEALDEALAA